MVHYAEAMRAKRRLFFILVAVLGAVAVLLATKTVAGPWGVALGWAALLPALYLGNTVLRCPACGKRMGSLFEKLCARCGAVLTDEPVMPPRVEGQADPRAAAFTAGSRRLLERWAAVRRKLGGKTIVLVGALAGLSLFVYGWLQGPQHHTDAVVLGLVGWPIASIVYWLVVVYGGDNLFSIYYMVARGRCPLCGGWFSPPSTVGLETIHVELMVPKFCPHCSAKLS